MWIKLDCTVQVLAFRLSAAQVFTDLRQLHAETDQVRKKVDLPTDLEKNAKSKGFVMLDNPGNGDCMFYALADQLKLVRGLDLSHGDLRQKLVAFLETHPKLVRFSFSFSKTWSSAASPVN